MSKLDEAIIAAYPKALRHWVERAEAAEAETTRLWALAHSINDALRTANEQLADAGGAMSMFTAHDTHRTNARAIGLPEQPQEITDAEQFMRDTLS